MADLLASFVPINAIQEKVLHDISSNGLHNIIASPEWSQPQHDLLQALDHVRQDPNLMDSVRDTLATEMKKPETRQRFNKDLAELTDTVLRIKQHFEQVSNTLVQFDARQFQEIGGEFIPALRPQWQKVLGKFNELLSKSRTTAVEGVHHVKYFRELILALAEVPTYNEHAIAEIDDFIKNVEHLGSDSDKLSTAFDNLRSELQDFKKVMHMSISNASETVEQAIKDLKTEINEVQADLAKYQRMTTVGWCSVIGAATVDTGIGLSIGLGIAAMSPAAWVFAIAAAVSAVLGVGAVAVGEPKKNRLNSRLSELNVTRVDLQNAIGVVKYQFSEAEGQIIYIHNAIISISSIWTFVKLDANTKLKRTLEDARDAKTKTGLVFQMKLAKAAYEILEANLETYAIRMADSLYRVE
ncbi:hypothetical protein C8R44DRAFT_758447 [Mycena epipterygia]|nr:hypothetical protein C8R44DRAFT_758447 [Mycena epipterygia]